MWQYERTLQFPVKIKNPDPKAAKIIITQFGGPSSHKYDSLKPWIYLLFICIPYIKSAPVFYT